MDTGTAHPREVNFYLVDGDFPDFGIVSFWQSDSRREDAEISCVRSINSCQRDFQDSYDIAAMRRWHNDRKQPRAVPFNPKFIVFIIGLARNSKSKICDQMGFVVPSQLVFGKRKVVPEDIKKEYSACLKSIKQYEGRPRPASVYQIQDFISEFLKSDRGGIVEEQ